MITSGYAAMSTVIELDLLLVYILNLMAVCRIKIDNDLWKHNLFLLGIGCKKFKTTVFRNPSN
jgi:hypothetical protein